MEKYNISQEEIKLIKNAMHYDPFQVLGIHKKDKYVSIRAYRKEAKEIEVKKKNRYYKMEKIDESGFFIYNFKLKNIFEYKLRITDFNDNKYEVYDPYSILPYLSDFDLHLVSHGEQHRLFEKLGAHITEHYGIKGTLFAVWAPNAKRVSVIGDFNGWDSTRNMMRSRGSAGIFELFIPDLGENEKYKFSILSQYNRVIEKTDPFAFYTELRPKTASLTWDINKFEWSDFDWIEKRRNTDFLTKPIAIYEVHLGSWKRDVENNNGFIDYHKLAHQLVDYVKYMGYTHIELLPILEHPFDGSWGYQVTGYYAPTSRFGNPDDFMYFVNYCHNHDIGVILDWVPAHFPKDEFSLARFDGTALYEHEDPRLGEHPDWGTLIFNYGRNETKNFLYSNALFWLDKYHVDGLRVDAVASMLYLDYSKEEGQWLPNKYGGRENLEAIEFIKKMNELAHSYYPGVMMIAEESTSWPAVSKPTYLNGLGFGLKWNMGWMNDFLSYMSKDAIYRKYHHNNLTFSLIYAFHENFVLPLSHDEVVHGKGSILNKMPGDDWQKFANLRLLYGYMYAHPGKKLLFMGQDYGQWEEWNSEQSLNWHQLNYSPHIETLNYVKELNHIYKNESALWEIDFSYEGFEWIDFHDTNNSVVSFLRKGTDPNNYIVVVANFTPVPRFNYRIGVPILGFYKEILNSDSERFYGSNIGNLGGVDADNIAWHNQPNSIQINLPPLAICFFKPIN